MTDRTIINDRTIIRTGERGPRGPKGDPGDLGGGVTDHGALTGLADDDHPQYLLAAAAAEFIRDTMGTALVAGANITLTVNDAGDAITIAVSGGAFETAGAVAAHAAAADPHPTYTTAAELSTALSAYLTSAAAPELIRDTMGTALVAGANITLTVNDAGDTITIAASGGGGVNVPFVNGAGGVMQSFTPGLVRLAFVEPVAALAANVTYYFGPFELDQACVLGGFITKISSLTGTAKLRLALVSVDPADLQPLALTYAEPELTYTTTGEKVISFASAQSVAAGVYFVAARTDNGTLSLSGMRMQVASGWRGYEEGYGNLSHFSVSEAYGAYTNPPTDWTAAGAASTGGTTGLAIPIQWRL